MNCSNCGAEMIDGKCPACGRDLPPGARGVIDPATKLMLAGVGRRIGQMFADEVILAIPVSLFAVIFDDIGGNFLGGLAGFIVTAGYLWKCFTTAGGQTLGNRVTATRTRDAATGQRISMRQATLRTLIMMFYFGNVVALRYPLWLLFIVVAAVDLGYWLVNPRKQTLHDRIVGTIVVVA